MGANDAGKGDAPRPMRISKSTYYSNHERTFGKKSSKSNNDAEDQKTEDTPST